MSITTNLKEIQKQIPEEVRLVAVSKYHSVDDIREAYNAGQRIFGESKAQELIAKHEELPQEDIQWHFIGHLQSNKIKYIAPFISLIHSVDTFRLLKNINKEAKKEGRIIPCLLQLHIADEDTKYGFSFTECKDMLKEGKWKELKNVKITGVMGMATFTEDENLVKSEFKALKDFFSEIQKEFFTTNEDFTEISMGMSQDYSIAIKEGSTLIRVGSKIFGERIY